MHTEIIITIDQNNRLIEIGFIIDGVIDTVEPFEFKHHEEHLKKDITKYILI